MWIVNEKIWVETDATLYRFVDALLVEGVDKEEIVLAFKAPGIRGFAVG